MGGNSASASSFSAPAAQPGAADEPPAAGFDRFGQRLLLPQATAKNRIAAKTAEIRATLLEWFPENSDKIDQILIKFPAEINLQQLAEYIFLAIQQDSVMG